MKVESFLSVVLVLSAFYQATAQNVSNSNLQCYDCSPSENAESCGNPGSPGTNVPLTTCSSKYPSPEANSSYQCISSNITFYGENEANKTGIYRGCRVQGSSVVDMCDWLKQETENRSATLTSCSSCSTIACNNVTVYDNAGSAAMPNMAVIFLMMTVIMSALLHSIC